MKKHILLIVLILTMFGLSCHVQKNLHGVWLTDGIYTSWISGEDTENFSTREVMLSNETYLTAWLHLIINIESNPSYLEYWGFKCVIDQIENDKGSLRISVHSLRNKESTGIFLISFIDIDTIQCKMISTSDSFWMESQNASFKPNRLDPVVIYKRCPKK